MTPARKPDAGPPADRCLPRRQIGRAWTVALLCLLTAVLWQLCFAPFDQWYVAYVVLVPWGLAVVSAKSGRAALLCGWGAGALLWAVATYWLTWITLAGYAALVFYLSLHWLAGAWFVRRAFRRGLPLWIVLPVVWVGLEYLRAFLLSGFPWMFLAHSQYRRTQLIQAADLTGQYGVSFFVAMVNGLILDLAARPILTRETDEDGQVIRRRLARPMLAGAIATLWLLGALLGYGAWRLSQETRSPGPRIGVAQCAFPISLTGRSVSEKEIFDAYMTQARRLTDDELDLMVWPETMLPVAFDRPWLERDPADFKDPAHIAELQAAQRELAALLNEAGCPLLAGGIVIRPTPIPLAGEPDAVPFNSAILLTPRPDGTLRTEAVYDKMHLVPFGEYVPLRQSWPGAYKAMRWFVPDVMEQLWPGSQPVRFETRYRDGRTLRFATPICYEGLFARVCRRLGYRDGRKEIDVLVNISNDGWFILQGTNWQHASTELDQHLAAYVFRAIEARVPVARAVNTGISGFIDSNGRIENLVVQPESGRMKMVSGTAERQVLVDSRRSVYSLVGSAVADGLRRSLGRVAGTWLGGLAGDLAAEPFALACGLATAGLVVRVRRRRGGKPAEAKGL